MNDAKPDAAKGNKIADLEADLQRLADAASTKYPQATDAALALLAAVRYDDETLVDSSLVSLKAALVGVANYCITEELAASDETQEGLREGWQKYINKQAHELAVLERARDAVESILHERVAGMLQARKLVHSLEALGQHVEKAEELEEGIRQLRKFREDFLRGWPSHTQPSPIDRDAISKAREAIRGGEKGMSKDQLIWAGKRPEKSV